MFFDSMLIEVGKNYFILQKTELFFNEAISP